MRFGFSLAATGLIGIAVLAISFALALLARRLRARRHDVQTTHSYSQEPSDVEQEEATQDLVRLTIDKNIPAGIAVGPKTKQLSLLLDQLEQLFLDLHMQHYAQKMHRSNAEIRNSDFHGVRRFLGAFQGYGRMDGVLGDNLGNDRLESLLDEAYALAKSIESEVGRA